MGEATPLDPTEGPTLWVEEDEPVYKLLQGTDPDDPVKHIYITEREVENLQEFIDS